MFLFIDILCFEFVATLNRVETILFKNLPVNKRDSGVTFYVSYIHFKTLYVVPL